MVEPTPSVYESNDSSVIDDEHPDICGTVQGGESSTTKEIHIFNNKGGTTDVSTMQNTKIRTLTKNLYESGDTVENGKEIIEQRMVGFRSLTNGDVDFLQVGGAISKTLGEIRGDLLVAPGLPTGVVTAVNGGNIKPGVYYGVVSAQDETGETLPSPESAGVIVPAMVEADVEDSDSESLTDSGNSKLSRIFESTGTDLSGVIIKMAMSGTLVVNVRVETDNSGEPSGTLAHTNAFKNSVILEEDEDTVVFFDNMATITDATDYHLVIEVVSGIGYLRGTNTGATQYVKYYDGTWHDSTNIKDLIFQVIGMNAIEWSWDAVTNALLYSFYRAESSGAYDDDCLILSNLLNNGFTDIAQDVIVGQPLETATVTREHKHIVERKVTVPAIASAGTINFYTQILYMYI